MDFRFLIDDFRLSCEETVGRFVICNLKIEHDIYDLNEVSEFHMER